MSSILFSNSPKCLLDLSVCVSTSKDAGGDKWCCQRTAPHCEVTDQIVKAGKGEGGRETRGEEGLKLENVELLKMRKRGRISKKGVEAQRVMKVFLLLSRVVFYLTICSEGFKRHKATMLGSQCTSAQFQTSHLSHYPFAVWACVCVIQCVHVHVHSCVCMCIWLCACVYAGYV